MPTRSDQGRVEFLQGTLDLLILPHAAMGSRARPCEGTSENNRRAKFYRLTAKGRRQLEIETSKWDTLAAAVGRILRPAAQEK